MIGKARHGRDRDGLVGRQRAHPRHAHQLGPSVYLGAARAALSRLAVPPHGEVGGLGRLDAMDDVEHDLAFLGGERYSWKRPPPASPRQRCMTSSGGGASGAAGGGVLGAGSVSMDISAPFLEEFRQFVGHLRLWLLGDGVLAVYKSGDHVDVLEFGPEARVVIAGVATAALLALDRGQRGAVRDREHRLQVQCEVPTGVELPVALDGHFAARSSSSASFSLACTSSLSVRIMPTSACIVSCSSRAPCRRFSPLSWSKKEGVHCHTATWASFSIVTSRHLEGPLRRRQPGPATEDKEVGERVATEPVGSRASLQRPRPRRRDRPRSWPRCRLRRARRPWRSDRSGRPPSASVVMSTSASSLNWWYIDGRRRRDVLGGATAGDVEIDAAVRASPARLHLGVDRAGDLVAGKQLRRPAEVPLVVVPLVALFDRVGGLGHEEVGGCS